MPLREPIQFSSSAEVRQYVGAQLREHLPTGWAARQQPGELYWRIGRLTDRFVEGPAWRHEDGYSLYASPDLRSFTITHSAQPGTVTPQAVDRAFTHACLVSTNVLSICPLGAILAYVMDRFPPNRYQDG